MTEDSKDNSRSPGNAANHSRIGKHVLAWKNLLFSAERKRNTGIVSISVFVEDGEIDKNNRTLILPINPDS